MHLLQNDKQKHGRTFMFALRGPGYHIEWENHYLKCRTLNYNKTVSSLLQVSVTSSFTFFVG